MLNMKLPMRVAVIGAGPSGLTSAKVMLEAGLVPTVFDRNPGVAGWVFGQPLCSATVHMPSTCCTDGHGVRMADTVLAFYITQDSV